MANDLRGGSLQVCRLRITKLDDDGAPLVGAGNMYVTDILVSLGSSPELARGDDFEQKNGCGEIMVSDKEPDRFKRLNLTMVFARPDPEATAMLVGGTVIRDGAQRPIGYAEPEVGQTSGGKVSIEAWTKHNVSGRQDQDFPWIRWVYPSTEWTIGDREKANSVMVTNFAGFAEQNANWGTGPLEDWPYLSTRVRQYALDDEIPDAAFGAQAVPAPAP